MTAAEVSRKRHTLREGLPAHFGSVRFPASKRPPSKWVGVPPDDGDPAMERLCKDLLIGTWGLQAPTVLISVTGGAQDFKLKAKLELIFRRGLLKAAETTNAWLVTGGTHAGVMKLVGKTILGDEDVSLPCIGVCTMGVIRDHERMKHESVGRIFPFRMDDGVKGGSVRVDLDPNHTHFVMVDDGSEGKFGKETQVRAALEDAICNGKASNATQGLPPPAMVQLVLAGGPFTLETVFATLNKGRPVVVLPESGGAAQHIYDFVKRGQYPQGASPEYLEKAQKLLPEIKRLGEQPKGANNTNQRTRHTRLEPPPPPRAPAVLTGSRPAVPTVSFFLTAEDEENESNDFDRFILEAILSDCEKTYDAVMLAVLWGDQATIRNQLDQSQTEDKKGLARALEQSLLRRDANVARVLLEYNVEAKYVNMDRLFKELEAIENEKQGEDTEAKAEPAVRPARILCAGLPHLWPRRTARASLAPIRSARVPPSLHRRQKTSCARPRLRPSPPDRLPQRFRPLAQNPVEKARTLSRQMTAHMQMSTRKVSTETLTLSTAKSFEYFVRNLDFVGYDYHIERRQELFGGGASMNMPPNWTDLMMWSALVATEESEPLVEALWTKCRNPIRSALMAARIPRHKAKEASDNYHKVPRRARAFASLFRSPSPRPPCPTPDRGRPARGVRPQVRKVGRGRPRGGRRSRRRGGASASAAVQEKNEMRAQEARVEEAQKLVSRAAPGLSLNRDPTDASHDGAPCLGSPTPQTARAQSAAAAAQRPAVASHPA